jgi:hypothetical protein
MQLCRGRALCSYRCSSSSLTFNRPIRCHLHRGDGLQTRAQTVAPQELTTLTTFLLKEERSGQIDLDLFAGESAHSLLWDSINRHLLLVVLNSISSACKQISALVQTAPVQGRLGLAGDVNSSGDEQKKLDVLVRILVLL